MDIDRLNSNPAVYNRLVQLLPWESLSSRMMKPFYKQLCNNGLYLSYDYTPDALVNDDSCFLMNKSNPNLSTNMTQKSVYKELRACGLREKKTIKLMKLLEKNEFALSFSSPKEDEGLIFFKGNCCIISEEAADKIVFPLLFSYSEWIEITREGNLGFDVLPLKQRRRKIFNTIRHNITIYDEMTSTTDYGNLARQIGEAVMNKYPALRNEVLSYWNRKEKRGENINADYGKLLKPNNVVCGIDLLREEIGEEQFYQSGIQARIV